MASINLPMDDRDQGPEIEVRIVDPENENRLFASVTVDTHVGNVNVRVERHENDPSVVVTLP